MTKKIRKYILFLVITVQEKKIIRILRFVPEDFLKLTGFVCILLPMNSEKWFVKGDFIRTCKKK